MLRHLVTWLLQTYEDRLLTSARFLPIVEFVSPPKVIDHLQSEECGRHDVDNASSSNGKICTRLILLKKSEGGGNTRLSDVHRNCMA
jgi:hypothetical protein